MPVFCGSNKMNMVQSLIKLVQVFCLSGENVVSLFAASSANFQEAIAEVWDLRGL